jgi:histidine triad (HIT) family protein
MSQASCLFCKMIRKEIPPRVALETEHILAFHDINPQAPTHVLVIPKLHIESLDALLAEHGELHAALLLGVQRVAREAGLVPGGYRTVVNTGPDAGQSVAHVHFHVLGGRPMGWPPG